MKVGIVGKGNAGTALASALNACDLAPTWWWSRRDETEPALLAEVDTILIAVADRAIADVARELAQRESATREVWLHLSGFHEGSLCRVNPESPRAAGSFHPLCALSAGSNASQTLHGCVAGIDGEPLAVSVANNLADRLRMKAVLIPPGSKALYHASAVTVAGHVTALFDRAAKTLRHCGFDELTARSSLLALMRSAVENLEIGPPSEVLTGPIARGDIHVSARHIEALVEVDPILGRVYSDLAAFADELMHAKDSRR